MDKSTENSSSGSALAPSAAVPAASLPGLGVRVFQNTTAILGGRAAGLFLSAGTSILLARFLGRERLGEYGAIYAYLSLYAFFATFCLEQILAREVSVRRNEAAQLFYTATVVALGFSLLGAFLAPLLAPLFGYSGPLRLLIVIAAVDMLVMPPFKLPGIIFQVDMRLWYSVAIGLFRQALWLIAVILLAFKSAAFYQVILARTACGALETVAFFWIIRRLRIVEGPRRFIPNEARRMLRDGFPLVLTYVAVGIYHRIDQVMLHKMSGDQVLGPYVIAVQLTELFSTLPIALMSSLFPALSQTASNPERFDLYLRESYRFLLVTVFAACTLITPVAGPFVEVLYGKQFLPTASLLVVLIWSEVPIFFSAALGSAMIAKNMQRHMPIGAGIGALMNILLNFYAIPRYGALGASWATVISYVIVNIFYLLIIEDVRPMVAVGIRIGLRPLLLAVSIIFVLGRLTTVFWLKAFITLIAYFVGAWLLGSIRSEDFQRLSQTLKGKAWKM